MPTARQLTLYRYRLPMRIKFKHATAARDANEGLLARLELADGSVGLGEGIPRPYVTGETVDGAIEIIRSDYAARLAGDDPPTTAPMPGDGPGLWHNAAWCACELAWLDAAARAEHLAVAEYLGRRLGRRVARRITQRAAGVISADRPERIGRRVWLMRLFGLRDFKVKIGLPTDREALAACVSALHRPLARGRATLRVDANGAWSLPEAREACRHLRELPLAALEQPLAKGDEASLPELMREAGVPIMLDESLVALDEARQLADAGAADLWNIRVSKCGGLMQSLALADLARERGIGVMVGAMVGESGVLTAAARALLQLVPEVRFVENAYGSFLLERDLVRESTRFGYGGKLRPLPGPGLGVTLDEAALEALAEEVLRVEY